jgi:hypothetical protein
MITAFTGPSLLTGYQKTAVRDILEGLDNINLWRSGCAHGVDTLVAQFADAVSIDFELYVPRDWHNERLVNKLKDRAKLVSYYESYRTRNEMMVAGSDLLVAFLKSEKFYRSGEWMTVNIAKKLGVKVETHII